MGTLLSFVDADVLASWNVATAVILLNVLVSLFSSAYDDVREVLCHILCECSPYLQVVEDAEAGLLITLYGLGLH
jgi:hypothetical protein